MKVVKTPATAMIAPTSVSAGDPLLDLSGNVDQAVLDAMTQHDYTLSYPPPRSRNGYKALSVLVDRGVIPVAKVTLDWAWPEADATFLQGAIYREALGKGAVAAEGGYVDVEKFGPKALAQLIRYHVVTYPVVPFYGVHVEAHGPGCEELRSALQSLIPLSWPLYWNNGQPPLSEWTGRARRGPMWENDPFQGGKYGDPRGSFTPQVVRFQTQQDTEPILFAAAVPTSEHDPINAQKYESVMAKAALLHPAIAIFAGKNGNDVPWYRWRSLMRRINLGKPIGEPYVEGLYGTWRRSFEGGEVIFDPNYPRDAPSPSARGRGWIVQRT